MIQCVVIPIVVVLAGLVAPVASTVLVSVCNPVRISRDRRDLGSSLRNRLVPENSNTVVCQFGSLGKGTLGVHGYGTATPGPVN